MTAERVNIDSGRNIGADVLVSKGLIQRIHDDKSGVVTLAHEFFHAGDYQSQKSHLQARMADVVEEGAKYGAAELFGRRILEEAADITYEEALKLVDQVITFEAQK